MQRQLPALPEAKAESLALWARQINKMLQDGTIVLQSQGAGNTSVRVATTANVNLANALEDGDAIDGITLNAGDLVLVKNQSTAAQNGIYKVPVSGAASRADAFSTYDAHVGAIIAVEVGTTNAGTTWQCTSAAGGTLGTTAINWAQLGIPIAGVSNAQLADMAQQTIKARKTLSTGDPEDCTILEVLAFTPRPSFMARKNAGQTVTAATLTKVTFQTEDFDTNNNFASSTFTPTVAGRYVLTAQVSTDANIDAFVVIRKNGSDYAWGTRITSNPNYSHVSCIAEANGSTDNFEVFYYASPGATTTPDSVRNYFCGAWLGP
jgi:hypothetical protein